MVQCRCCGVILWVGQWEDLWHSLRPLGLSSVKCPPADEALAWKKKSASSDSLSVSREQSESLLCSREVEDEEEEKRRRRRRRKQNVAKKSTKWVILQLFPPHPPLGNGCSLPIGSLVQLLFNVSRQIDCVQLQQHFDRLQPNAARQHCGLWTFISAANRHSYNSSASNGLISSLFSMDAIQIPATIIPASPLGECLLGESQKFQKTSWNPPVVPASEWVSEWLREWVSEWVDALVLCSPQTRTYWHTFHLPQILSLQINKTKKCSTQKKNVNVTMSPRVSTEHC